MYEVKRDDRRECVANTEEGKFFDSVSAELAGSEPAVPTKVVRLRVTQGKVQDYKGKLDKIMIILNLLLIRHSEL